MYVVEKNKDGLVTLPVMAIDERKIKACSSTLAQQILKELASKPSYPMELAKRLHIHEQKIYYHIRKLERAGLIEAVQKQEVHGAAANVYATTAPGFVILLKEFEQAQKLPLQAQTSFLEPIISNGLMNGVIVVGSPDPHGPEMARSRDGYYGIDLALFLGTFLSSVSRLNVRLDTEVRAEDLQKNLILIGGPVVNTVSLRINKQLPIRFSSKHRNAVESKLSGKIYHADETGVILKIKNPFNSKKQLLFVAGKRYSGTRAAVIAFLKHFTELSKPNKYDEKTFAHVVEGVDLDSDGIVDDVRILE